MSRATKKFIYGVLYLALLALILLRIFSPEAPSRGGSPTSLSEGLRPLAMEGDVVIFTAADGSAALMARVRNPNPAHRASSFSYSFQLMRGMQEVFLETPRRSGFAYPSETAVLLETLPLASLDEDTRAALMLGAPTWEDAAFLVRPTVEVARVETLSNDRGAVVTGEVKNAGSVGAAVVRLVAILKDVNGFPLFAAQAVLEDIPRAGARSFTIWFPRDRGLAERASPAATELLFEAR